MDKNFVHIDDLFREGLRGAEEPEQAGAWLRMQELLDAQMPTGQLPVRGGGWPYRRYLTILLVLLCTGSGAYFIHHQWNQKSAAVADNSKTALQQLPNSQTVDRASHSIITTENKLPDYAQNAIADPVGKRNAVSKSVIAPAHTPAKQTSGNPSTFNSSSGQPIASGQPLNKNAHISTGFKEQTKSNTAVEAVNPVRQMPVLQTAVSDETQPTPVILANASTTFSVSELKSAATALLEAAAQQKIYQNGHGDLLKKQVDTINQVIVRETTVLQATTNTAGQKVTQPQLRTDTLQEQRIAITTFVPLTPLERTAAAELKVEPVVHATLLDKSVLYASGEREVKLVTLSKYAVSSRKSTPEKINQMISNTSYGISNMFDGTKNYYAGIIAGGNLALGNPSAYGLQVGLAGFYALSERLTAGVELRYINRYYSNYQFLDRYAQYQVLSSGESGGNWIFNYEENVQSSTYRIQNIASVELPVYLNYSFGRLSVFGGANFAYAFDLHPIVNHEVSTSQKSISSPTQNFPITSAQSQVTPEDWNRRFGIGYIAGVAYDFNRRFTMDLRVTQNLWDNAATEVSKEISKQTFRVPSLQLGLTLNFGRRDKVIYILDNRR